MASLAPRPHLLPWLLAGLLTVTVNAQGTPTPLADAIPELADHSSWAQDTTHEGPAPDKRTRGVFPVGNGHVFGYMGLGERANTMQAITGPHYQTDETFAPKGHFGELTLDLLRDGDVVALPQQQVRRVRGANFVVTHDHAPGGLSLRTITFAAPTTRQLTRIIEVHNAGDGDVAGLALRARPERAAPQGDTLLSRYESEARAAFARYSLTGGDAHEDGSLRADLGDLGAGSSWTGVMTISTGSGEPAAAETTTAVTLAEATAAARETLTWWQRKIASTSDFSTDHRKLDDLVRDWKVMMLAQRCAQAGIVSPMVNHRGAFVRDSMGPMMLFLRFRMWDEARAILEYFHDATRLLGRLPERADLDLDFAAMPPGPTDWANVQIPSGEIPSWIILQHFWYWRATQDTALISKHWPLLDSCLKKQQRGADNLMKFQGTEPYLHGALFSLYPERVKGTPGFITEDRRLGREGYSFASAVQFLLSVHAMGALVNGLDRTMNPERWAGGKPENHPGLPYLERGFELREDIEKRFWLPEDKFFAPAISPVTGAPHRAPVADVNLMPLWVGWTYPSGEKSRDNLARTLAMVWQRGKRIGTTPTVGHVTGQVQGMLLTALAERDAVSRLECLDELLKLAEPAGEWGELYDPEGRPIASYDAQWPNRARPWESGVNIEAIMFAISGIRFNFIPDWDNDEIRAKIRMPHGATHVTMKDIDKDGRRIHLYLSETNRKFSDEEREENAGKIPEKQLDPDVAHRRLDFRMELVSDNPAKGYYDAFVNIMNTVYVRYLWKESPVVESQLWNEDNLMFFPRGNQRRPWKHIPLEKKDGATMVVFTSRNAGAEIGDSDQVTLVDTGMAMRPSDIARMLVGEDGEPAHQAAYFDWGWDSRGAATFKAEEFWSDEAITTALKQFADAGGQVIRPGYFERYRVEVDGEWQEAHAPGGRLHLAEGTTVARLHISSEHKREAVLRLGSGCGLTAKLNGQEVFRRTGARDALPDTDAVLVQLAEGDNVLEFELLSCGDAVLYARLSDSQGMPVTAAVRATPAPGDSTGR